MLTAAELAEILGFAPGTIVDWAERDEIPPPVVQGRRPAPGSASPEVAEWLEQRRQGVGVAFRPEVVA